MTGSEMRKEAVDYLTTQLEKRKNELVLKMPEIYIKDIQEAYSDGLKSGLRHHSYDYLEKTADLKKRYEKQKELLKKIMDWYSHFHMIPIEWQFEADDLLKDQEEEPCGQ